MNCFALIFCVLSSLYNSYCNLWQHELCDVQCGHNYCDVHVLINFIALLNWEKKKKKKHPMKKYSVNVSLLDVCFRKINHAVTFHLDHYSQLHRNGRCRLPFWERRRGKLEMKPPDMHMTLQDVGNTRRPPLLYDIII